MCGEFDIKTCIAMLIMDRLGIGGSFAELHPFDFNSNCILIGIGPACDSPSPIIKRNLPFAYCVMPSMVMEPSLSLNSTEAPLPSLP